MSLESDSYYALWEMFHHQRGDMIGVPRKMLEPFLPLPREMVIEEKKKIVSCKREELFRFLVEEGKRE